MATYRNKIYVPHSTHSLNNFPNSPHHQGYKNQQQVERRFRFLKDVVLCLCSFPENWTAETDDADDYGGGNTEITCVVWCRVWTNVLCCKNRINRREKQMYEAFYFPSGVENDSEKDDLYNKLIFGTIHELSVECGLYGQKKYRRKQRKKSMDTSRRGGSLSSYERVVVHRNTL